MKFVTDKSFIQGNNIADLAVYQDEFDFVITQNFLYELCKTEEKHRKSIANKLLALQKDTYYLSVEMVLSYEVENNQPFDSKDLPPRQANRDLLEELSSAPLVRQEILDSMERERSFYIMFYEAFIPYLTAWHGRSTKEIIADIRSLGISKLSESEMNSSWGTYNLLSCLRHYAENIGKRYQRRVLYETVPTRVLHDLLDIDYAVLGIVCGGIATRDKGILECLQDVCTDNHPIVR